MCIMIVGLLHLPMALSLIPISKTQGRWHIFSILFYIICSVSQNIAMMLHGHRLYLHSKTWKKLTYISGISLWNLALIYLMDVAKYPSLAAMLQYVQFAVILIIQENKPQSYQWNWYPIWIYIFLFVMSQLYSIFILQQSPRYNYKNLAISIMFFCFAYLALCQIKVPYTFDPKKETDDYLRIYHSLTDMCIGIGFHWFWKILPSEQQTQIKQQ